MFSKFARFTNNLVVYKFKELSKMLFIPTISIHVSSYPSNDMFIIDINIYSRCLRNDYHSPSLFLMQLYSPKLSLT